MTPHDEKLFTASIVMLVLAAISFLSICFALSGCARFQNRGDMFEKGIFEKGDSIAHV